MKTPIFLIADDVLAFDSVLDAERYVEPIDAKDGTYWACDCEGRLLRINVAPHEHRVLFGLLKVHTECVVIEEAEEEPFHKERLLDALKEYLLAAGKSLGWVEGASFDDIVSTAVVFAKTK